MRRPGAPGVVGAALALVASGAFIQLTEAVLAHDVRAFNVAVSRAVHATANPVLDQLALVLSEVGGLKGGIVLVAIAVATWMARRQYREAGAFALVAAGAGVLGFGLKRWFQQPRPDLFEPLVPVAGYGYPSGHAIFSVALYGYLAVWLAVSGPRQAGRWVGAAVLAAVPLGVMWSRVYLGAHWLTDVAAGALVAALWSGLCLAWRGRWVRPAASPGTPAIPGGGPPP